MDKICTKCGKVKDISQFFKSAKAKDGYKTICKDCCKIYNDKYRQEHLNEHKKYMLQYNAKNKDKQRQYYEKHKEELLQQSKEYRQRNKDRIKEYRQRNKDRIKEYNAQYHNTIVEKECANPKCKRKFMAPRRGTMYCSDECYKENYIKLCKETNQRKYGVDFYVLTDKYRNNEINKISEINRKFANILTLKNIKYQFEYTVYNYSYDFFLPEYNLLVEINPTFTHSNIENVLGWFKNKNYHYNKVKTANDNGYQCICVWDWDNKEAIIEAVKNNTLKIEKHEIQKHWNICETSKHMLDNNFDEQEMISEGWVPIYDDGQTLIY